jgi:plasmid stability protein
MATSVTIRGIDEGLKQRLRLRAAQHGRSMEEELRVILKTALSTQSPERLNLVESIRRHIEPLGGVELTLQPRAPIRRPPKFDK